MTAPMGYEAYQHNTVNSKAASASPQELVVMLCDAFLDNLDRIEGQIEEKDFERKGETVKRCIDILAGLDINLDMENGGQLAQDLHNLYDHMRVRLHQISLKNDVSGLQEIRDIMTNLRDGWQGLGSLPESA